MKKHNVFLSPLAEKKILIILDYILEEWGINAKRKFLSEFKKLLVQISFYPESCPASKISTKVRKCIITRQNSFLYRIIDAEIEIITVFDNRQNQSKVFEEIKQFFATNL